MMIIEFLKILGLIAFSSVKFLFATATVYLSGYSYVETLIITTVGGVIGVVVFYYGGAFLFKLWNDRFGKRGKPKSSFNKKNRFIIRIKNSYGIYGLALFSPCLISIPIGSLLAARYYRNDKRTLPAFLIAVVFWSIALTSITASLGPFFVG